jgi:hypothetical protein
LKPVKNCRTEIFHVQLKPLLEEDVQWIFIDDLRTLEQRPIRPRREIPLLPTGLSNKACPENKLPLSYALTISRRADSILLHFLHRAVVDKPDVAAALTFVIIAAEK